RRADGFEALSGRGVKARVDGRELYVGGPALLAKIGLTASEKLKSAVLRAGEEGKASIYLTDRTTVIAAFIVADIVRPESRAAIRALHERKIDVVMMTGDAGPVAQAVASELGIN